MSVFSETLKLLQAGNVHAAQQFFHQNAAWLFAVGCYEVQMGHMVYDSLFLTNDDELVRAQVESDTYSFYIICHNLENDFYLESFEDLPRLIDQSARRFGDNTPKKYSGLTEQNYREFLPPKSPENAVQVPVYSETLKLLQAGDTDAAQVFFYQNAKYLFDISSFCKKDVRDFQRMLEEMRNMDMIYDSLFLTKDGILVRARVESDRYTLFVDCHNPEKSFFQESFENLPRLIDRSVRWFGVNTAKRYTKLGEENYREYLP